LSTGDAMQIEFTVSRVTSKLKAHAEEPMYFAKKPSIALA
jgi:hypothetical protein